MVVADECKVQREPNKYYRWNSRGQTPVVKVDRKKGDAVSFYGGLSYKNKQVIGHITYGRQNSKETCLFLEEIKKTYKGKGKVLIVWDGASHHFGEVNQWLKDNPGVVELTNFPPYCPDLNPQEHVWKAMRANLLQVQHQYSYQDLIDRACRFLRTQTFDYQFPFTADLI